MREGKIIRNRWQPYNDRVFVSRILSRDVSTEGLDFTRYRCEIGGTVNFEPNDGHIVSLLKGKGKLTTDKQDTVRIIEAATHLYIPATVITELELIGACEVIVVSAPGERARGNRLLIRNEKYVRAVRFILTPQYLSRRIFVHRDETILSKYGTPVSWFHTTMFNTKGLPTNFEGEPVLKMGYDNQSEPNVCYDVLGDARVRFAKHPYVSADQQGWSEWEEINNDTLYYLNEPSDGDLVEWYEHEDTKERLPLRNRHEVFVPEGGHVTLMCLFDPAPTGLEQHMPGEYSSYTPVAKTLGTKEYTQFLLGVIPEDEIIDKLSVMEAEGKIEDANGTLSWSLYETCLERKIKQDNALYDKLKEIGEGRETIINQWMIKNI